jgi:predicted Zn-ribbon and HTH transcriptional regulator
MSHEAVYLVKSSNAYKIGITANIRQRLAVIQIHHPWPISLVGHWESVHAAALEQYLKHVFSEKHLRGEWFELSADDIDQLQTIASGPAEAWLSIARAIETNGRKIRKHLTCKICKWSWWMRANPPDRCPHCHSTIWNRPPIKSGRPRVRQP